MRWWTFLLPLSLFAQMQEPESMLFQAEELARCYAPLIAKMPPPPLAPLTEELLRNTSKWLAIDLSLVKTKHCSVLASLSRNCLWEWIGEIGFDAVELKGLKGAEDAPVSFHIDPNFGTEQEYLTLATNSMNHDIRLIGRLIGNTTGKGLDFALALKNVGSYPGLYSLIEIPESDWDLLPCVKKHTISANIPWLMLDALQKKGYVPQDYQPYVKTSDWNATEPILSVDNKLRRWIYLRNAKGMPKLGWLNPTFASERLAAGDALHSIYKLGQPILQLDAELPKTVRDTQALTVRKLNGYSAAFCKGGVKDFVAQTADLLYDHLSPMAALHALFTEDAEILRMEYKMLLEENLQPKRFIHSMLPFRQAACDWQEFLAIPRKKYRYYEEELTGDALRTRLLKNDREKLQNLPVSFTWMEACASCIPDTEDLLKRRNQILELHLLMTKFFAWQPGVFCLSANDLLGATDRFNFFEPAESLYASIPTQFQNQSSYVAELKKIFRIRSEESLERAELIEILPVDNKGLFLARYTLCGSGHPALLAVNFSKQPVSEVLESPDYVRTSAIDLYSGKCIDKTLESSFFILDAPAYTARLIAFRPKNYP